MADPAWRAGCGCPQKRGYGLPEKLDLIVFDFDGVFTDNRVWVDQNGVEQICRQSW